MGNFENGEGGWGNQNGRLLYLCIVISFILIVATLLSLNLFELIFRLICHLTCLNTTVSDNTIRFAETRMCKSET